MFGIENCYRIIFEAMLEDYPLHCIAERIGQYTDAGVAFVSGTGRILSCSHLWSGMFPVSAQKGSLAFEDYTAIYGTEEPGGWRRCITPVRGGRMVIGHVVLVYEEAEAEGAFQELGRILEENTRRYFEEEQKRCVFRQPLKEHMIARMLFEDRISKHSEENIYPEGKYMVVLFGKEDGTAEEMALRLRRIWNLMYIYEEKDEVFVLYYQVTEQDAADIYEGILAEKQRCCVSEVFSKIRLCKNKMNTLRRIAQLEDPRDTDVVRREKDWSMRGMYTYAASLVMEAGLSDYSMERLVLEDEKNNTELYYSLKVYLLCENNVTAAAKRLHIHRNTLVYRLKRIREFVDRDINDYEVSRELLAYIMMSDIAGQTEHKE